MSEKATREITAEQSALISLLAHRLFGGQEPDIPQEQIPRILQEAELQSVFPLACAAAGLAGRPPWMLRFQQHYANNLNVIHAHHAAHRELSAAGIPYLVIKGCASARYYPEPELRTMGDVDIFVNRENMERVDALMTALGSEGWGKDHPHHWSYMLESVETEVHWVPSGIPAADDGSILALFRDLMEKRVSVELEQGPLWIPSPYHHGLILLLHTANHMTAGGVGLRQLLDWLCFENSFEEGEFLSLFAESLEQIGLMEFARVLTAIGVQFFGCSPRAFCRDVSPELARDLLLDFFAGGNFGVKDQDRLNQSKLLRDNESRQIRSGGELGKAFRFLNQRARACTPAARCPLLLPIGWVRVLLRRRRYVKKGRQKQMHLGATMQSARAREALYEQLKLFE